MNLFQQRKHSVSAGGGVYSLKLTKLLRDDILGHAEKFVSPKNDKLRTEGKKIYYSHHGKFIHSNTLLLLAR